MLKSLNIKNYAIIDNINIDFNDHFNVFTGETGAGKSIIVGALTFLLKGKADSSVIRKGFDKAIIEGVFSVDDYMKEMLKEADIEFDQDIIIKRVISNDNHNSIKINDSNVTLQFLTNLLSESIDIHSQKESQFLLNKANHLNLLDKFCNNKDLLNSYKVLFNKYSIALDEYNDLLNNTYNESELEYIKFDYQELEDANINLNEENELSLKEKRYKSAEKFINVLNDSINLYDAENGIDEKLSSLVKLLNFDDENISNIKSNIQEISYSLNDEIDKLKNILDDFSNDDLNIDKIEERLYLYSKLKRKHNLDVEGLINKKNELLDKIKFFEDKDFILNEKKIKLDNLKNDCLKIAKDISSIRQEKAIELQQYVLNQTDDLMLNNVQFKVMFDEKDLSINGIDNVEFYISLNKGDDLKPLKDVASGGEISRLMLALKTVFIKLSNCSLAIFDEIDTGVSGKVGLAMGQKMANIAKNAQVIAITHLAPVAACADEHYYIYKEDNETSSNTKVKKLNEEEIIEELAFISSSDNSESAIKAAEELYNLAQNKL